MDKEPQTKINNHILSPVCFCVELANDCHLPLLLGLIIGIVDYDVAEQVQLYRLDGGAT